MLCVTQLVGFGAGAEYLWRYMRLQIDANNGDGSYSAHIGNFRVKIGATAYPTSDMTSDILPSPLVATGSSLLGGYQYYYAFDNTISVGNSWVPANATVPSYIQCDIGVIVQGKPTTYSIWPSGLLTRAPKDFRLLLSVDGTTFDTVDIRTGLTTGWTLDTERSFSIA